MLYFAFYGEFPFFTMCIKYEKASLHLNLG